VIHEHTFVLWVSMSDRRGTVDTQTTKEEHMVTAFAEQSRTTYHGSGSSSQRMTWSGAPAHAASESHRKALGHAHALDRTDLARLGRVAYVVLLVIAVVAVLASLALKPAAPSPEGWSSVTVGESDSLWSIAKAHAVPGLSTAETADLIADTNQLPSTVIMLGQTIRVPSSGTSELLVATNQ